jgi:hypothetical protein
MSGAAHPTHELHRGDIPYEAPFVRSASPNDSLTTAYGADETSLSDVELSEDSFSTKVLGELRIHEKREEEERAETRPLMMPRPRRGSASNGDEKGVDNPPRPYAISHDSTDLAMYEAMFDQVMRSLRWHVEQIEDQDGMIETKIETALQRRTVPEAEPSTSEIDMMMEKMMEPQGRPPSNAMTVDESVPCGFGISGQGQ